MEEEAKLEKANELAENLLGYHYDRSLANVVKQNEDEAQRLLRLEQGKSEPRDEQYDIKPDVEHPGASSSSKPEDTRLTVEEAKEVFNRGRGRGRPVSVLTISDEMLADLIDRSYADDKKERLYKEDIATVREIAKERCIPTIYWTGEFNRYIPKLTLNKCNF